MSKLSKFEFVSKTAYKPRRSWTNKELAQFHYFNPNGLNAKKRAVDEQIDKLVDEGLAKSGAMIAYGGLNCFYTDLIAKVAISNRVGRIELAVIIEGLERDIQKAKDFIAEKLAESETV